MIGLITQRSGWVTPITVCSVITLKGYFEAEQIFGKSFTNSDGKTVYTRYVGEQHVREDCNGYIPSAKEWMTCIITGHRPDWMRKQ